jgi:hypothetical protein
LIDLPPIPKSQQNTTCPENEARVIKESLARTCWRWLSVSFSVQKTVENLLNALPDQILEFGLYDLPVYL